LEHDWPWDAWGSQEWADEHIRWFAPTLAEDLQVRRWFRRWAQLGGTPSSHYALMRMNLDVDVRAVLPTISVPALVLHVEHERSFDLRAARYLAENIPGAELVVLPGDSHAWFAECAEQIAQHVERFLTGIWERGEWDAVETDRVLATVLFTDIVGSTTKAAELGDRAWRELLTEHHRRVRRQLARFRGSTPPATASSRGSMARRGRSGARARSPIPSPNLAWSFAPVSIRVSASSSTARSAASPFTSGPVSRRMPSRARCASRRR